MTIHIGLIGAGIGAQHLQAYHQLHASFTVTAICDLDVEKAAQLRGGQNIAITADYTEILADDEIDLVDICLPPHLHYDAICAALRAGKHVICEKPLVSSCAEVDEIEALARERGLHVFPVFQYRFGNGAHQLLSLIEAGFAGTAFTATLETHWNRDAAYYDNAWRGTWAGEQGGAILGHAIHIHDFLCTILGPVAQLYARLDTRVNDIEVEDCAAISFTMANGAVVTSSVTLGGATDHSRLRFCFKGFTAQSAVIAYQPAEGSWQFTARAPASQQQIDAHLAQLEPVSYSGYAGLFYEIALALAGKPHRAVRSKDAKASLELVTAIYHSARTNQPVHLPLSPSAPGYHGWIWE